MLLHSINFKVAGVTFENEDGKNIQKEIKDILKDYKKNNYFDELYGGYTNEEIKEQDLNVSQFEGYEFPAKLVGDEYNSEECFKIYFKTYDDKYIHIGYAPRENITELAKWLTKENINVKGELSVIGGKYKYCELYEEDYEEKERVVTEELTYGIEIQLEFYDNDDENTSTQLLGKSGETLSENKYTEYNKKTPQNIEDKAEMVAYMVVIVIGIIIFVMFYRAINWLLN